MIKKYFLLVAAGLCLFVVSPAAPRMENSSFPSGTVKGRVIDADVKSPIPDVLVSIAGTDYVARTDAEGTFSFSNIPVGNYILQFTGRFYASRALPDVTVKPDRLTTFVIELHLSDELREEQAVTVTAAYFEGGGPGTLGVTTFSYEEIRRAAGSAGDVSRIISGLPSVARTHDMVNTLVVRGGSPDENAFYIDNIEIPNINHYPRLGASIGSLGLLNVEFIRDVDFSSGAFSPRFGNRLSSVMDISFRDGNRDEFDLQFDLSMMGAGLVAEGPLNGGAGAWMVSARRSYVDLLIDLMGQGVPVSWSDFQGKATLDLSPGSRLTFLGVAGIDNSGTEKQDALKDGESYFGGLDTIEYATGVNWFLSWGERGYSNTSLSMNSIRYTSDAFYTVSEEMARRGESREQAFALRSVSVFRFNRAHKLEFGLELKHILNDYNTFSAATFDVTGKPVPEIHRDEGINADSIGGFIDFSWRLRSWLSLNLGIRGDHFTYNGNSHLSPRVSMGFRLSERTSLEAAAGLYYQHLPLVLLLQNPAHRDLRDPEACHFVLGLRHLLAEDTQLTLEVYDKEYRCFPLDPDQPALFVFDEMFTGGFFSEHAVLRDHGRARSRGIEFMIQKKLSDRFYGVFSAAYFRTGYRGLDGIWRNRVYDNRVILSLEGGWRPAEKLQFGMKWTYAGGIPYTPFDLEASQAVGQGVFDPLKINQERLPAYISLNLRVDKRFDFRSSNLNVYVSVWNVLNRRNPFGSTWNMIESRPDFTFGWGLLPVLGLEFEF